MQNQNILNVNSKRSYDSELDHIVNDLHFKVEFVDDNKEEVEEIIEVEETDTSYMLHLSLDQTLNLQKGNYFIQSFFVFVYLLKNIFILRWQSFHEKRSYPP